ATHALLVQPGQPSRWVVSALKPGIGRAVVCGPELLLGIERRRIQTLVAVQGRHLRLNQAVVVPVGVAGRQRDRSPETAVPVHPPPLWGGNRPTVVAPPPH